MNLYVQGVDINLINDVDGMFEAFRKENDFTLQYTSESIEEKEPLKFHKIIDILLTLQPSNFTITKTKESSNAGTSTNSYSSDKRHTKHNQK